MLIVGTQFWLRDQDEVVLGLKIPSFLLKCQSMLKNMEKFVNR